MIVSGFRAALDLDTYSLSKLNCSWCAEQAKRGRGKPVFIIHIGFFTCFYSISLKHSRFSKIATLFNVTVWRNYNALAVILHITLAQVLKLY